MPIAHITKIEDARTGQWLRHLDHVTDPIRRIDMGWTMGDWNQLDVGIETVGLRGSFFLLPCLFRLSISFATLLDGLLCVYDDFKKLDMIDRSFAPDLIPPIDPRSSLPPSPRSR
jgi:hypothetical protein